MKKLKAIPGYCNYYADREGRIFRKAGRNYRQLTMFLQPYSKYLAVYVLLEGMVRTGVWVHKLVALAYHRKDIEKYRILHRDGNLLNNSVTNLSFEKYTAEEESEKENLSRKFAIRDYEQILRRVTGCDDGNIYWKRYIKVKQKGKPRHTYNWLYIFLKSRKEI